MNLSGLEILTNVTLAAAIFLGVIAGARPLAAWILKQEQIYGHILRTGLLLDIRPRSATIFGIACVFAGAVLGYVFIQDPLSLAAGAILGAAIPMLTLRLLRQRRLS